jgi:hypothetical protein
VKWTPCVNKVLIINNNTIWHLNSSPFFLLHAHAQTFFPRCYVYVNIIECIASVRGMLRNES